MCKEGGMNKAAKGDRVIRGGSRRSSVATFLAARARFKGTASSRSIDYVFRCLRGKHAGSDRVLRGGSWNDDAAYCRAASRSYGDPEYRDSGGIGLRCMRREG
jgi:formylglycine-generating enzyme required for sulfatase activity